MRKDAVRHGMAWVWVALGLGLLLLPAAGVAEIEDFAFIHFSDSHLGPQVAGQPPVPLREGEKIAWLVEQAVGPQAGFEVGPTPAPSFALVTGDLTEYGVIDDTWALFERAFDVLPYPVYVQPGNHDNTWVAMYHIMRVRHGGENYSFQKHGCHFIGLNSASPQEPVPTIDGKTRAWLRADLAQVPPGTPVFIALHHPPYGGEFSNPAEYDTFIDLLRDHNVVLVLYGHGHGVAHRDLDGLDGTMGGSTFGRNAGYAVVSVQDGTLRVAYRFHTPRLPAAPAGTQPAEAQAAAADDGMWLTVLSKPLVRAVPARRFEIVEPAAGAALTGELLTVKLALAGEQTARDLQRVRLHIDGVPLEAERNGLTWTAKLPPGPPGWRHLSVRGTLRDGSSDLRAVPFRVGPERPPWQWRLELPTAIKATPLVVGELVILARTDGLLTAHERTTGREVWRFKTGGEILGTPAWDGERLIFGSGDQYIYAVDRTGKERWRIPVGVPVYAPPVVADGIVYVGDNGGRFHALRAEDGQRVWIFERASFAIEAAAHVWGDLVVFGAWDGYLYAVQRQTGALAWKQWGPKSSEGGAARYYAPADCAPLSLGDRLFVCDRGYLLATYAQDGERGSTLATSITAISADVRGTTLFGRSSEDRLVRWNAQGEVVWTADVPAGRFPIPPTVAGDTVYVCSNRGLLSALNAESGGIRAQVQLTPGFFVMAGVGVDADGTCYVAGMDGSVTAIRFPTDTVTMSVRD